MRLFTALWPDAAALADVDALLGGDEGLLDPARWRVVAPERRHVTLCFHGDAGSEGPDPDVLGARLRAAPVAAAAGLRLRCAGAGRFGDALWLGVVPDDPDRLGILVAAAGADPAEHVAHLTVARRRRGGGRDRGGEGGGRTRGGGRVGGGGRVRGGDDDVPPELAAHRGPWWTVGEITLVASEGGYRVLDRVVLA